jgi:hypothetical protein
MQLHASSKIPTEADIVTSSSALMAMPIGLCSSSGLQASEYPAIEQLVFAGHSSRNDDELNPEFLCSLFHSLFAMRTEQVPEHHNRSALDSRTEPVKIVACDKRVHPSIGLVGKDQFATPDVLLQSGIVAVALLATFRLAFAEDPQGDLSPAASTLAIAARHFLGSLWNKHSTPLPCPAMGTAKAATLRGSSDENTLASAEQQQEMPEEGITIAES